MIVCDVCREPAVWMYGPGGADYCAEHVPRGCFCNTEEDGVETFDTDGRRLPCVDYIWIGDVNDAPSELPGEESR